MARRAWPWLPWLLNRLTLAAAALLLGAVVLAPWLDDGSPQPEGGRQLVAVFARDGTLRRTTVASAIGLAVTAFTFFRPAGSSRFLGRRTKPPRLPPPDVVGA